MKIYLKQKLMNEKLADIEGGIEFDISNVINPVLRILKPDYRNLVEN